MARLETRSSAGGGVVEELDVVEHEVGEAGGGEQLAQRREAAGVEGGVDPFGPACGQAGAQERALGERLTPENVTPPREVS